MNGRNTTVVSLRLPDSVVETLNERAGEKTVSEYLRGQIIKSCTCPV